MNDPSQQFQLYLEALPQSLNTMAAEKTPLEFAQAGYVLYCHPENWTKEHVEFIQHQITNDLNDDSLSWYEEDTEVVRAFSCFALGAALGKLDTGSLSDQDFLHMQILLPGFISTHNEAICDVLSELK